MLIEAIRARRSRVPSSAFTLAGLAWKRIDWALVSFVWSVLGCIGAVWFGVWLFTTPAALGCVK